MAGTVLLAELVAKRKLFDEFERTRSPIAEEGLRRIQALYAIEAEINGHNPEAYITAVLDGLAKGHLASRIDDLLPWNLSPEAQAVAVG